MTVSCVPLLGALCIAEGFITQAQLDACLARQVQELHGTPIGQILLHCGYISEPDLARMVAKQRALRRKLLAGIEQMGVPQQPSPASAQPARAEEPRAIPELADLTETDIEASRLFGERNARSLGRS